MMYILLLTVGLAVVILLGWAAAKGLARRSEAEAPIEEDEWAIDISALPRKGPPPTGPQLEVYHVPVRLAVFVLAPVGRDSELPSKESLPGVVEQLAPGLFNVLSSHQPLFQRWPAQLSARGFEHTYFRLTPLPGDHGKGTVWCSVAGRFEAEGQAMLAGMTFCAGKPNGLGEIIIESFAQWLDVIRIKANAPSS